MSVHPRFTSRDLELLPDREGVRYEIIDGELYVSRAPTWEHQFTVNKVWRELQNWSDVGGAGVANSAPGLVFAEDQDVIPDVVWISRQRLAVALDEARHLRIAPELVVEVLSPGSTNERRDLEVKLKLYSRQGVEEYWVVDWRVRTVQVYRRAELALTLVGTLREDDVLTSRLLPGFASPLSRFWPT
jgi:Uma2 family endonuclease